MNVFRGPRRKLAIAATSAAAVIALGAGAAYAYITLTATGSASAEAAAYSQPTVSNLVIQPMLPGTTRGIGFTLTNPNNFPIKVTSIQRVTDPVVTGGGNCAMDKLTGPLSTANPMAVPGEPVVGAGAHPFSINNVLGLSDTADAACAVTFDVKVTAIQQGN